jgi:hypothetical protein
MFLKFILAVLWALRGNVAIKRRLPGCSKRD